MATIKSKTPKVDSKAPAKNGFKYSPKFGVIVNCTNEAHQKAVYDQLNQLGYNLKVVVV
ncbi:hypothetical protein [Psychrobacter aquaticus]|uniref:Uncharacterized protein n=1 Tax=Psychrobacter aquaticus CMS 56 TaxID=1354303 RepID=U4TCD5_9GAMM|nr:hypothetical protein [Psychrobacter aquaticus]ERL56123.1 hypothetical protein M917_0801 [Psychrobacter aquaticus CMS 56]